MTDCEWRKGLKKGNQCYIVESNCKITPVTIVSQSGNLYTIRLQSGGGIRVPGHRLHETEEAARDSLPKRGTEKKYRSPYDYM